MSEPAGITTGGGVDPTGGQAQDPGQNQSTPSDWRSMLSEEWRENPSLKDFKSLDDVAKSYAELKSYQGRSIAIPTDDASEEDRKAFLEKITSKFPDLIPRPNLDDEEAAREFFKQLGAPEKPEEYPVPELPEGVNIPEDRINQLRELAFEAGVTKDQFQKVMAKLVEQDVKMIEEYAQRFMEGHKALREEWGVAYDERVERADQIREQFFPFIPKEEMNADTAKALYEISLRLGSEPVDMSTQGSAGTGAMAPAEAQQRIDEIMRNREHPYWNPSDPGHEAAVQRVIELQKMANPGASSKTLADMFGT